MNKGITSGFVTDSLIARQHDVDRLKTGYDAKLTGITIELHSALAYALASARVSDFKELKKRQLAGFVKMVITRLSTASDSFKTGFESWLKRYVSQESRFGTNVMNVALGTKRTSPSLWSSFWNGLIGASGMTARETVSSTMSLFKTRVKQFFKRAFIQKWSTRQVRSGFIGTVTRNRKDGLIHKLKTVGKTMIATVIQAGESAARLGMMKTFLDVLIGYRWVSILDGRTSQICRSMSQRVFEFGEGPVPPLHYNCRSHIEPLFKSGTIFNRGAAGAFEMGETYYTWLKRQPETFQNSVLGPTWGKIFRTKGLTAEEFADKTMNNRYQPVTLTELEKTDPRLFKEK